MSDTGYVYKTKTPNNLRHITLPKWNTEYEGHLLEHAFCFLVVLALAVNNTLHRLR